MFSDIAPENLQRIGTELLSLALNKVSRLVPGRWISRSAYIIRCDGHLGFVRGCVFAAEDRASAVFSPAIAMVGRVAGGTLYEVGLVDGFAAVGAGLSHG